MNTKIESQIVRALALVSLFCALVDSAHAVPITYGFTSARSFEANLPSSPGQSPGPPSSTLPDQVFALGEVFSGTFMYDSAAAPLFNSPTLTLFSNALTNLSGSVDGHQISVGSASALIRIAPLNQFVFNGNAPGMVVGDWASSTFSLYFGGYTSSSLPLSLPPVGTPAPLSQFSLDFINSVTGQRRQVGFGSVVITPVAEPASWSLLMIGVLALALMRRRTPKEHLGNG